MEKGKPPYNIPLVQGAAPAGEAEVLVSSYVPKSGVCSH